MNAMVLDARLEDRFAQEEGGLFLTGTQALAKLPLLQRSLDRRRGLNTAGFISGYRGSPLGNLDAVLWSQAKRLEAETILFRPGVNEELAATAVWGTQQANVIDVGPRHAGVFAMWYGKGPGVDRATDALKHGNLQGAAPLGGVLVLAGDDHGGKSSTLAFQSEPALAGMGMPVLHPASVADYLTLGLWGWALSRATGLWVGFKCLTDTVESARTVSFRFADVAFDPPEGLIEPFRRQPLPFLLPMMEEEALLAHRLPAALAFAARHPVDHDQILPARRRLGLIAVGKAYGETRQALADLGLDEAGCAALGVGLRRQQLVWPIEPEALATFARGFEEVLVIEEKRAFVEPQAAQCLYNLPSDARPRLGGKRAPSGERLLPEHGELNVQIVRAALLGRLEALGLVDAAMRQRAERLAEREAKAAERSTPITPRTPAFCSGCPHSRSTRLPEGALAFAGIGCHTLAIGMPDRPTVRPTQMGGEGLNWVGMAPFVERRHAFQNLGDGTYFHSGLLAVRAAVAAGTNVTFKVLFNDAVAMTGGQPVDGDQSVADIAAQLVAERVGRVVVVADDVERHRGRLPERVELFGRDALLPVEKALSEVEGVTALIYDQTCAAEKRRRRKRGTYPDPARRYVIDPEVCEGCGDCGRVSNCVSLTPEPTLMGTKRRIDQSACNKDYTCADGFCPSFLTVDGGDLRRRGAAAAATADGPMPADPVIPALSERFDLLVVGIGGTGVVTIGAVIGQAAHMAGLSCSLLDLTGLSQKNGAVASHVRLAPDAKSLHATRIGAGDARALIGCDLLVAAAPDTLKTLRPDGGLVVNTRLTATAAFQFDRTLDLGRERAIKALNEAVESGPAAAFDASAIAERLFGDAIFSNMMMLGAAYQAGLAPIPHEALERAIALNGVAVEANLAAFRLGRRLAADPALASAILGPTDPAPPEQDLDILLDALNARLEAYQDAAYAASWRAVVMRVSARETERAPGSDRLTRVVAVQLARLMTYKDEYEVARLLTRPGARSALAAQFEGSLKVRYNLAPPLFAPKDRVTGRPRKISFGAWLTPALKGLAALRRLRGTRFDLFGMTHERRREREAVRLYLSQVETLLEHLSADRLGEALAIAGLADGVRGYGHVKEAAMAAWMGASERRIAAWTKASESALAA